jgi:protein-disulfide isomerase
MASRTKQKEEARARRLAEEQARAEQDRRRRRLQMLGGVVLIAAAIIAVAIALSSGGGGPAPAAKLKATSGAGNGKNTAFVTCKGSPDSHVCGLLSGIPQSGNTLGNPKAKVTVTEYGDLECSVCDQFALSPNEKTSAQVPGSGIEDQLIQNDVKSGKVKLVYRSLETASGSNPDQNAFLNQQTAAEAAGLQNKEWYYVELFYHYQGQEGTNYVTQNYLSTLAKHVPGLNFANWQAHLQDPALQSRVSHDEQTAASRGFSSTPTLTISGPKGEAQPITEEPSSYSQIESEINQVL